MDINLLLSPQEPTPEDPPPAPETSTKKSRKLRSSKVVNSSNSNSKSNKQSDSKSNNKSSSNDNSNSSNSARNGSTNNAKANSNSNSSSNSEFSNAAHTTVPRPLLSHSVVVQAQHVMPSPPLISPVSALRVHAASTPPADGNRAMRQPSTPRMDTLADLASMQHHQQTTRANAGGLRSAEIYENQPSSTSGLPQLHVVPRSQGSTRGLMDLPVIEPQIQSPSPRHYSATSLTETEVQTVAHLVTYLATNPFAYESHIQLVKLLHQGLVSYVHSQSSPNAPADPHRYDLLQDLRNAREAMNATFALGEDLWVDWIEDQQLLAKTLDDKITVIESCQKALDQEPGSTRLWLLYAEWMLSMFKLVNTEDERALAIGSPTAEEVRWSEEDIALARSVCSWEQMLGVWTQGVEDTKWRINDSHLIWNRYTELIIIDLGSSPSKESIEAVKSHFLDRLQMPHATWEATSQLYSTFVSRHENLPYEEYEETMVAAIEQGSEAKIKYAQREVLEVNLQRGRERGDMEAEWKAFNEYIDWEMTQSRKKLAYSFELVHALHQRATLRFPSDTALWEGFVMFLNDEIISFERDVSALPILNRATIHCPWSGTLWSQYLLAAERNRQSFPTMHNIKHKATSTGLLDAGDMLEVLKVHTAWCGFLRRRAFHDDSTDEDMDVAEVGIRSAIEDMETLGREKYGKNYQGDPEYRLQRIYIKYLTQCCNWQGARNAWKGLVATQGDSYDFWLRYYLWEMSTWGQLAYGESGLNGSQPTKPSQATHVLQQALQRPKLDWPEKILETFQHHCEEHEDVEELQAAVIQIWKARKLVASRREKEALHALEVGPSQKLPQQEGYQDNRENSGSGFNIGKRKRGDDLDGSEASILKKYRLEVSDGSKSNPDEVISSTPKRDRENSTVIVRNLPNGMTETRVRQYFRDCGTINSLKLLPENDSQSITATIEFDSKEDVLTAQTKDMKIFDGNAIEVQVGTGSTLFVTNFPATAGEADIREMFAKFGEVVDVRFPSLKKNTHRRFCYVQLKSSHQARSATSLDGKVVGAKHKLIVKISDPDRKQARTGALYEGRELHLLNLDWSATEDDIQQIFAKYGKVERARIPRDVEGKSKGFGFVVFSSKEEATAALEMNIKLFKTRILYVSLSTANPAKRQATTIVTSNSPSPELARADGGGDDAASPIASTNNDHRPSASDIQSRTLALLNVPDTVNDSRIRAVAEPYGALVKVVLRPDHQGAILEYRDTASAGKAALGLEGHELIPGRKLGIGTVREMLHQKAEVKSDRIGIGRSKKVEPGSHALQGAAPIRRPTQPSLRRGGGKGGLGIKRRGPMLGVSATAEGGQKEQTPDDRVDGSDQRPRSNADFKAMFLNG